VGDLPYRLRVLYTKRDRLRFLSHLEVTRAIERSARRAALPYAVTEGFHAKMRVAFGPALPVGTAGLAECYELWLREYVPANEALARLQSATPSELEPLDARYVGVRSRSVTAVYTLAEYAVDIEGGAPESDCRAAVKAMIDDRIFTVEQKAKSKSFDLASVLLKEPVVRSTGERCAIELMIRMGDQGSLRPESFVKAVLERSGGSGRIVSVTRTSLREEESEARPS